MLCSGQVGDGARYPQHPRVAACAQPHGGGGLGEQGFAGFVGGGVGGEGVAVGFGIGAGLASGVARGLEGAGGGHAGGDGVAVLTGGGVDEVGGADGFDIDRQIDAVEQRAGDARLIIGGAARGAAARKGGVAEMAAAAGVHRRDELDAGGEGDVGVGARDADRAGFERLAQRIEHRALEFGEFVEEEYAEMREADFAGADA